MIKIFSYGSLGSRFNRSGEKATLTTNYKLDNYGIYPALIKDKHLHSIEGEILEFDKDELIEVDHYEGYPDLYSRKENTVKLRDGTTVSVWFYFLVEEEEKQWKGY